MNSDLGESLVREKLQMNMENKQYIPFGRKGVVQVVYSSNGLLVLVSRLAGPNES